VRSIPARAREPGSRAWISSAVTAADGTRQAACFRALGQRGGELVQHRVRLVADAAAGEAEHEEPGELERDVAPAILLEGRCGVVGLAAVGFHDDAVLRPQQVHREPAPPRWPARAAGSTPGEVEQVMLERAAPGAEHPEPHAAGAV
jgi:hypothetical protein